MRAHDSRTRRWSTLAAGLSLGSVLLGCGSSSNAAGDGGPGVTDADPDGTVEASVDGGSEAAVDAGGPCPADGAISILGDYTAPDGSERWLRKTATATTFSVVPGGAPDASSLPSLYRVASVCSGTAPGAAGTLALAGLDGSAARLDWTNASGVSVCFRAAVATTAALALPPPDGANTTTGCGGAAWLALTKETP
jgi:hypothetical protein